MPEGLPWLHRGQYVLLEPDPRSKDGKKNYYYLRAEEGIPAMDYDFSSVEYFFSCFHYRIPPCLSLNSIQEGISPPMDRSLL